MLRRLSLTAALCLAPALVAAQSGRAPRCHDWRAGSHRNPTDAELRCHFGVSGPGRFGLLSYVDVPVYQPDTPMPGTHVVGVAGMPHPRAGESYETWEWRVLRTSYGPEARRVYRSLELLDPRVAARILKLEARLAEAGIREVRRETWRSPERQAYLFQQGRSRPGPLATATLTSWHSLVDARGRPAGRAVDYDVPASQMVRFHRIVHEVGLESYGADSFDPGHVFLPDPDAIPEREVVLLRVLPRVPEVTLSTGLPVDRSLPAGGRAALRAEALAFASSPFGGGMPRPHLASAVLRIRMVRTPVAPRATARELAERGRGRGGG